MPWINKLSIKFKLLSIILLVTLTATSIITSAFIFDDIRVFRKNIQAQAIAIAVTVGDYSVSDLTFGDQQAAQKTLAKLQRYENLINVELYDNKGQPFASYPTTATQNLSSAAPPSSSEFSGHQLQVTEPIYFQGRNYGTIRLKLSTAQLYSELVEHIYIMLLAIVSILLLSYVLANRLQQLISNPIIQLTKHAREVEKGGDYSHPISVQGDDEISVLTTQLNSMMSKVVRREISRDQAIKSLNDSEERVRLLLDSTAEAIYGTDEKGRCTFANPACLQLLGYEQIEESLENSMRSLLLDGISTGKHITEKEMFRKDGSSFFSELWAYPVTSEGRYKGTVVTFLDISDRKATEASMSLLFRAVNQSADSVLITDERGLIQFINPSFEKMTGYSKDVLIGANPSILKSGIHDDEFYKRVWEQLNQGQSVQETFMNRRKSGELYYQLQTITPLKDSNGKTSQFVATSRDVSSEIETQKRLHTMAYHDALTGLPNRELFRDRLEHAISKANRDDALVPVIFLDLDHFKNINDTLGHPVGDRLLQKVSERIVEIVRESDTVARLGGDEFTILLENAKDLNGVANRVSRLVQAFSSPFQIEPHEVYITASIGVAVYPQDVKSIDDLFRAADTAMYRAKADGRNTFKFFTADMAAIVLRRVTLEKDLRHALENNEFCLYYQPRVSIDGNTTNSVEALIRWVHPRDGLVPPDNFIPIMEEIGIILEVGQWVWKTAFDQLAQWHSEGIDIKMAINVSPRQFQLPGLITDMLAYLNKKHIAQNKVELEITEAVLLDYTDSTNVIFNAIRDSDLHLAIDDFGTGFSSLSYLKKLPLHTLKIDRSFVTDILTDTDDSAIVACIISLAKSLGLSITAEGVETQEQLEYLANAGCDEAQGYLISKPLPSDVASQWIYDRISNPKAG